jgi:RES domain-containing protein
VPPIVAWRIVKSRHSADAFSGEGARRAGGRWNSPGTSVVYLAETIALATIELLVHLGDPSVLTAYVLYSCSFPESIVEHLNRTDLPSNWRSFPAPLALRQFGDEWVNRRSSAVLSVPSAITGETNYLLNPHHPDFTQIVISDPRPYALDPRLLKP